MDYYIVFLFVTINCSFAFSQNKNYPNPNSEHIIFKNYDQKEYKVKDFKNKHILVACLSIYTNKLDSISYFMTKYYDNYIQNSKENYIFIIVLYDEINHTLPENIDANVKKYESICQNTKGLKSNQVFLTFEMGIYRNFSKGGLLNGKRIPIFNTFYINDKGEPCYYNRDKKTPCYTKNVESKLNFLEKFSHQIYKNKKFLSFF